MTTILITGGTGKVGSRVIEQVAGRPGVRALAHSDASAERLGAAGVDVVRGSLADPEAVARAVDGVERVFLLSTGQAAQELGVLEAARAAGVRHVVKLSSLLEGWDLAIMEDHRAVVAALRASGLAHTILQPDTFMDNEAGALDALRAGVVVAPTGDGRCSFVDARDIAAVAVHELTAAAPEGGELVITGPAALTFEEYAQELGAGIGRELHHVSPTVDAFAEALRGFGVPEPRAGDLAAMYGALDGRLTHAPTDTVERLTGRAPRAARTFAAEVLAPALAVDASS